MTVYRVAGFYIEFVFCGWGEVIKVLYAHLIILLVLYLGYVFGFHSLFKTSVSVDGN